MHTQSSSQRGAALPGQTDFFHLLGGENVLPMPLSTVIDRPPLADHVYGVDLAAPQEQVGGVTAWGVVTLMADHEPSLLLSWVSNRPGELVCSGFDPAQLDHAVCAALAALPLPAVIRAELADLAPEFAYLFEVQSETEVGHG